MAPDDSGLLYGEGVFETLHLRPSGPWLLDEHLDRMASSAALLDLPLPSRSSLASLARAAVCPGLEGALRLVCTGGGVAFATVSPVPPAVVRQRLSGIRVITTDVGRRAGHAPPWSLSGAKTISYAESLAARRWAVRQGFDDVLMISTDGYALESPTASLVWLAGGTLGTVPPAEAGILPGTTAAHLLSRAGELGLRAESRMITRAELDAVDGIWLASSLRGLAEAVVLDGASRPRSPWTPRLLALLGFPSRLSDSGDLGPAMGR